jgi:hypothetical protein
MSKEIGEMSEKQKTEKKKLNRYSISVSGKIYDRLRAQVISGSLASYVDEIVEIALDDPAILVRLVAACRREART